MASKAYNAKKLNAAIRELGFYFGEIGQHAFMHRLLSVASIGGDAPPGVAESVAQYNAATGNMSMGLAAGDDGVHFGELLTSILGMTDGGTTTKEFIESVDEFTKNAGDYGTIAEKITSETDRLFTVTSEDNATGNFCNGFKLTEIMNDKGLNKQFDAPSKDAPNIAVFQWHDVALNFANREAGVCGTFMNAIPTVEMSKCQPYVDVKVITTEPAWDE